MDLSFSLAIQN